MSNTLNTTTTEYDALNRIRKLYYPKDRANQRKILEPTYNKGGALYSVKLGGTDYVGEIGYNARGQRILLTMGNGVMTRYTYDLDTFRLLRTKSEKFNFSGHTYTPSGGTQQDLAYLYDLEGTILEQNDHAPANTSAQGPGGLTRQFAHDPLRRLISATGRESSNVYTQPSWDLNLRPENYTATNNYTRTYSYDKLGNIQELDHKATGHSNQDFVRNYGYSGDFNNNWLKQFSYGGNTYGYQYDANGNITKEGDNRYFQWTQNDKPATYSNQAGSSDPTVYTNYFYNAAGERVKKHTRKGQQIEVTFYRDGGLFETSYVKPTGGSIDSNRFYNTLHVLDGTSRIATVRIGNDADDPTPAVKYFLEDHLMDNLVVLKTDGSLINREEFYPFGETSFGSFAKKRYRFNGKEKDEESGLYYYGQRYYAPWLCRFVSVDPIAEDYPQLSSYNYAGNKPITSPDVEGLQGTEDSSGPESQGGGGETVQLPDRGGMPNFLLPEVEITGTHSHAEGETKSVPSAQINPVNGTATIDIQTYFYHRGLGEHDTESGWFTYAQYSENVFKAGKSDGYSDMYSGNVSEPFYSDGRPLAENFEANFSGFYDAGVGAGASERLSDMTGKINTEALEFEVILAVYTLGQGNWFKQVAKKTIVDGTKKSGQKVAENSSKNLIDDFVQSYRLQGAPKRAPKGGARAKGKVYQEGELMPGDELFFGRNTWTVPDPGSINSLRPDPTRLMNGPIWLRYSVAGGGSGLIIHWGYRKLTED